VVCVSEAYEKPGFINEVMMQVQRTAFDYLDAPMVRVAPPTCRCHAPRYSKIGAIPNVDRIPGGLSKVVS